MVKARVVFVEMEGPEEAVLAAIRSFLPETQMRIVAPVVAPLPTAPAAPAPKAIAEAPKPRYSVSRKKTHTPVARAAATPEDSGKPTISDAIRQAVREGPKTNGEVLRHLVDHGFSDVSSSTVSTLLCQLRAKNEIFKGDDDLKWHVALPAAKH